MFKVRTVTGSDSPTLEAWQASAQGDAPPLEERWANPGSMEVTNNIRNPGGVTEFIAFRVEPPGKGASNRNRCRGFRTAGFQPAAL